MGVHGAKRKAGKEKLIVHMSLAKLRPEWYCIILIFTFYKEQWNAEERVDGNSCTVDTNYIVASKICEKAI